MFDENMFNNKEFEDLFGFMDKNSTKDLIVGSPMSMDRFKKNLARVFNTEDK